MPMTAHMALLASYVIPEEDGDGYVFSLTAGNYADFVIGYAREGNLFGIPAIGSIDAEPVPGHTLDSCFINSGSLSIYLLGDATALLAGRPVKINGVSYGDGDAGWTYNSEFDVTAWSLSAGAPTWTESEVYACEFE